MKKAAEKAAETEALVVESGVEKLIAKTGSKVAFATKESVYAVNKVNKRVSLKIVKEVVSETK